MQVRIMNNVARAFLLTLFAGLSTGIGSAIAFYAKKTNTKFLSVSLGISAGVMVYVSFVELLTQSMDVLGKALGAKMGSFVSIMSFFTGVFLIAVIDKLVPSEGNPHEMQSVEKINDGIKKEERLLRTGFLTALAVAVHNFPEGFAAFASALQEASIAIPIAVAIAIHNIPEGIAVSVPIYYATGDKKKAFVYSFLSGLSEPLGALLFYLILFPFINDIVIGAIYACIAGIMVFISIDELLPSAREYGEHHLSVYGFVGGMAIMAFSLLAFI